MREFCHFGLDHPSMTPDAEEAVFVFSKPPRVAIDSSISHCPRRLAWEQLVAGRRVVQDPSPPICAPSLSTEQKLPSLYVIPFLSNSPGFTCRLQVRISYSRATSLIPAIQLTSNTLDFCSTPCKRTSHMLAH